MSTLSFLGIDVSQASFDVALDTEAGKSVRFPNSAAGFVAARRAFAAQFAAGFTVVEATGGHERALLADLVKSGARVHRVMPYTARCFARSLGFKAKTDRIDAVGLARYARERHETLPLYQPPSQDQSNINSLMMRRDDLTAMLVAEKARLGHPVYRDAPATVRASVKTSCERLAAEIAELEAEASRCVARDPVMAERSTRLQAITGIGPKTALILQGFMPELGSLTAKTAASLAGLAPHPRDSGTSQARRTVQGGRARVKRALYTAAMAARKHDPAMNAFFNRIVERGKPKMVALVAVMRKLITHANAALKTNTSVPFQHGR